MFKLFNFACWNSKQQKWGRFDLGPIWFGADLTWGRFDLGPIWPASQMIYYMSANFISFRSLFVHVPSDFIGVVGIQ